MSMTQITALQLFGITIAYLITMILVPHLVIGKTFPFRNRYERFMIYCIAGNFYIINLVFVLELLHISYPVTLIIFTIIPCAYIKIKLEKIPFINNVKELWDSIRKIVQGQTGTKAFIEGRRRKRQARIIRSKFHFKEVYLKHLIEVILIVILLVGFFHSFAMFDFQYFGYKASDVVVHNAWINSLDSNELFYDGIYPYGFHNVVYYYHAVFGFDTYVLLRLIPVVYDAWIVLLLLCFMQLLCKTKYLAFLGTYIFAIFDVFFIESTQWRFVAALPQEFSMQFILPCIYFAIMLFKLLSEDKTLFENKKKTKNKKRDKKPFEMTQKKLYVWGLATSFSMTLAIHFYGTMIAGVYFVALVIGYCFWFFKKPYLRTMVCTCLVGLGIALAPMVIAFAMGTPLQASLGWGLSVMTGKDWTYLSHRKEDRDTEEYRAFIEQYSVKEDDEEEETEADIEANGGISKKDSTSVKIKKMLKNSIQPVKFFKKGYTISVLCRDISSVYYLFLASLLGIFVVAFIFLFVFHQKWYGGLLLSSGIAMIFLSYMVSASYMGLPQLMPENRASVFVAYFLPIMWMFLLDGVITIIGMFVSFAILPNIIAFLILLIASICMVKADRIKPVITCVNVQECNDDIICMTNIISSEEDETWTIVSCNDAGRMVTPHGFHYETYTFLRLMEGTYATSIVRIPTQTVYFFVEKVPIDFDVPYENSGQSISKKGASRMLPYAHGRGVYEAENRWIIMSRLYYWCETFMELYPNEMSVYYETDDFICYRCEQNPQRLFNFSIDYYYNTNGYAVGGN